MPCIWPYRKNPRYFQDPAGYPVYLCGVATPDLAHRIGGESLALLERLVASDVNAVAIDLSLSDRNPALYTLPYHRARGEARGPDGFRRFDLERSNEEYWARLASTLKQANRIGLYVLLRLFPELNGSTLTGPTAWNPDHALGGIDVQGLEAFVQAAVDATATFPNVMYQVCEGMTGSLRSRALEYLIAKVEGAPVLAREEASDGWGRADVRPEIDADPKSISKGRPWIALDAAGLADRAPDRSARDRAWQAFLGGAAGAFLGGPIDGESGGDQGPGFEDAVRAAAGIRRFIRERRIQYWKFAPGSGTGETSILSRANERYLAAPPGPDGSIALDLTGDDGAFTASWWHADEAYLVTQGMVLGGSERRFTPPGDGPWILDLFKRAR